MDDDDGAAENHRNGPAGGSLPRRSAQNHLEPQLRETRGSGDGTPFTAFGPAADPEPDGEDDPAPTAPAARAAGLLRRSRRGRSAG